MKKLSLFSLLLVLFCNAFTQNLTSVLYEDWDNPGWLASEKLDFTYNANNYLIKEDYFVWNVGNITWDFVGYADYTNNANGQPLQFISQSYDGFVWQNETKGTYTYNATGKLLTYTDEVWNTSTSTWQIANNEVNTYDNNDYLIQEIQENYNNGSLNSRNRYTYTNNASGIMQQSLQESWNLTTQVWNQVSRTNYTYNVNGKVILALTEVWINNAWVQAYKENYSYDVNNYLINQIYSYANISTGQWIYSMQYFYTNLANGKISQISYQSWNSTTNAWENSSRDTYFYGTSSVVKPQRLHAVVFPNPTSDYLNLQLDKPQPYTIKIINLEGELVMKQSVSNPLEKIDIRNLVTGTYLLQVEQGRGITMTKFVKAEN